MTDEPARQTLIRLFRENRALQAEQDGDERLDGRLKALQGWQCERLLATHADLAAHPRYGPGVDFFVGDLYAPKDFSRRDADIERALPAMTRLLPEAVQRTVADVAGLYVLSRRLDRAMTKAIFDAQGADAVTPQNYAEAYRICDAYAERAEQIDCIARLAGSLDRYVRSRVLLTTLRMTRVPARLAGLGALQDFLERGFSAFHYMQGSSEFVGTIVRRERAILDRIFTGHVAPFDVS